MLRHHGDGERAAHLSLYQFWLRSGWIQVAEVDVLRAQSISRVLVGLQVIGNVHDPRSVVSGAGANDVHDVTTYGLTKPVVPDCVILNRTVIRNFVVDEVGIDCRTLTGRCQASPLVVPASGESITLERRGALMFEGEVFDVVPAQVLHRAQDLGDHRHAGSHGAVYGPPSHHVGHA